MFRPRYLPSWLIFCLVFVLALAVPLFFGLLLDVPSGTTFLASTISSNISRVSLRLSRLLLSEYMNGSSEGLVRHLSYTNSRDTLVDFSAASFTSIRSTPVRPTSSSSSLRRSDGPVPPYRTFASLFSAIYTPSYSPKQPPQLSATLLIVITAGSIVVLSFLAAICYCCARCRRSSQGREKRSSQVLTARSSGEKRMMGDLEVGRTTYGSGVVSPSVFEFSPPSPTWRPTLPSLAYVSSSAKGSENSKAPANGRGEILDAETIMREREPGRRKVYGGGGWPDGRYVLLTTAKTGGAQSRPSASGAYRPPHPYAQTQPFPGRVGVGMPAAPPLPPCAPQIYRPPAYHRPSRIVPAQPSNDSSSVVGSTIGTVRSASVKGENSKNVVPAGPQRSKNETIVTVPRIEVHPAQDVPSGRNQALCTNADHCKGVRTLTREDAPIARKPINSSASARLQRNSSVSSQSGRPISGLGISTINLGRTSPADDGSATTAVQGDVFTPRSRSRPRSSSPGTPNEEDVRLAYTVSIISVAPEPVVNLPRREEAGRDVSRKEVALKGAVAGDASTAKASKDKRKSRLQVASTNMETSKSNFISSSDARRSQLSALSRKPSTSSSMKGTNTVKRQALGVGAIDQTTKSELHDMRSLGSESFDSLIAYLEESAGPEKDGAETMRDVKAVTKGEGVVGNREMKAEESRVTREETARVDEKAYEEWVGSLNASPSVLKLAHVEIGPESAVGHSTSTPVRPRRRSRSASESAARSNLGPIRMGKEAESELRVPLQERDMNVGSRRTHARNKSVAGTDAGRNTVTMQGKVGMHVRALRARSASLRAQSEDRGTSGFGAPGTGSRPQNLVQASDYAARGNLARTSSVKEDPRERIDLRKCPLQQEDSDLHLSARDKEAVSSLPSFSVPSTATQLFAAFPSSEASLSGSLTCALGQETANSILTSTSASVSSKKTSKTPNGSAASALASTSSSKTMVGSVSGSASTSKSKSNSNSKAVSSAAYIARCAPTPSFRSKAVLSFLSTSSSSPSPSPPSPSLPHLPEPHSHSVRVASRSSHQSLPSGLSPSSTSIDSVSVDSSSSESGASAISAISAWGRRREWGRESLTPRFDHLRAVLEGDGRFEESIPPMPVTVPGMTVVVKEDVMR